MSAESYELLVSLLGSALGGLALFSLGVFLGYLIWGGLRKQAKLARTLGKNEPGGKGAGGSER